MRVVEATGYHEPRDALSQDWFRFLKACDITPVLVPNVGEDAVSYLEGIEVRGVILTGGNNVCPATYGADPSVPVSDAYPERDVTEAALIDWAASAGTPLLGVCRGMHMLNAHFGGNILTDLARQAPGVGDHVACEHKTLVTMPKIVERFGFEELATNSYHNQGLTERELAESLENWAVALEGGVIEAVAHRERPLVGIQWHPERPNSTAEFDRALVRSLFVDGDFFGLE